MFIKNVPDLLDLGFLCFLLTEIEIILAVMEEEVIIPTEKEQEAFRRLSLIFSNHSKIMFHRITEKTKAPGLSKGDVVIIDRDTRSAENDLRMYLDRDDMRYIVTRTEISYKKYMGRVSWILKSPRNLDT